MKTYMIRMKGHEFSEKASAKASKLFEQHNGFVPELFDAFWGETAVLSEQKRLNIKWTCPHSQGPKMLGGMGCAFSHLALWQKAADLGETVHILEHDAFTKKALDLKILAAFEDSSYGMLSLSLDWNGSWKDKASKLSNRDDPCPDFIKPVHRAHGHASYLVKPWAARELIDKINKEGRYTINDFWAHEDNGFEWIGSVLDDRYCSPGLCGRMPIKGESTTGDYRRGSKESFL